MALVINGQCIEDGIIEAEFAEIKAYFERLGNISCCERDPEFRGYARENVVARVLLSQEASRRLGRLTQAEVDEAMRKIAEPHGGEAGFLTALGAGMEQLDLVRNDVEADLRVRKMIDEMAGEMGEPDEEALQRFHGQRSELFMTAEEVRASHILKASRRGEDRQKGYDELREVRERLLANEDFEVLARQHSDKASDHIDLGFFKRGELPEELEAVAFSMSPGEVSPVFLSSYGYHLLKVTERKLPAIRPFDTSRDDVMRELVLDRRQKLTRTLVDELKAKALIEEPASEPVSAHVHA